jgi:hypothetical protein
VLAAKRQLPAFGNRPDNRHVQSACCRCRARRIS